MAILALLASNLRQWRCGDWDHAWKRRSVQDVALAPGKSTHRNRTGIFGYTSGIVPYLTQHGVSADRITAVQNAVDTGELRKSLGSITEDEVDQAKSRLGIATGPVVWRHELGGLVERRRSVEDVCAPEQHTPVLDTGRRVELLKASRTRQSRSNLLGTIPVERLLSLENRIRDASSRLPEWFPRGSMCREP